MNFLFEAAARPHLPVEMLTRGNKAVEELSFASAEEWCAGEKGKGEEMETAALPPMPAADDSATLLTVAREEGMAAARREYEAKLESHILDEKLALERLVREFRVDRQRYFSSAEVQVVRLSLAIARRVLAREVQTDELTLEKIAVAALARVQDGTESVLKVPPAELDRWCERLEGPENAVKITADRALSSGELLLETSVGRVDLSIDVQMEEIERGFEGLLRRQGE